MVLLDSTFTIVDGGDVVLLSSTVAIVDGGREADGRLPVRGDATALGDGVHVFC